jgi:hypothetical protein
MAEWITDRLPTAEDADGDCDVQVPYKTDAEPEDGVYVDYRVIVPGQPWWSLKAEFAAARAAQFTPPPALAPARVVTALAANEMRLHAACNDGTIWAQGPLGDAWEQLPSIPQPEAHDA